MEKQSYRKHETKKKPTVNRNVSDKKMDFSSFLDTIEYE